jgi:long-chain acyl-CoA synthetase
MFENPRTLGRLLIEQAERQGSKTYLYHEDLEVSYGDLLDRAARVRDGLTAAGIRGGDRLALLLTNGPEFLYAWFGAALLGVVTVPINPAYKNEEIRYILDNAGASGIVVDATRRADVDAIRGRLPALRLRVALGGGGDSWKSFDELCRGANARPARPSDEARPEDAAAIIYTSGTTGHPKGVVLTHRNYHFDAWSLVTHLETGADDRFLCFLPLFHVNAQVVSVLSALLVGGSLVLLREFKPSTFLEIVARYRATTFSAVPTVYAILNTLPDAEKYDLSSLRFCICGAAPMPVEVFKTFERKFNATIVEGYGLSEATCGSCINPVGATEKRKIGSIGVPLPGQEMKIFDDGDRELPDGQIGEIVVRGEAVMREYFRNPEATAETLRSAWLHTGDIGYRDGDGYFFIVGRKKEMIIRGGENIYPKEIEEVVYRHPAVQEAAVVGVPDPIWGEIVCACVVPKTGMKLAKQEIVDLCKANLADFKVPARVEIVDSFPKTPTGKIQKGKIILT